MIYNSDTKILSPKSGCYLVRDYDGKIFWGSIQLGTMKFGRNIIELQPSDFSEYEY